MTPKGRMASKYDMYLMIYLINLYVVYIRATMIKVPFFKVGTLIILIKIYYMLQYYGISDFTFQK